MTKIILTSVSLVACLTYNVLAEKIPPRSYPSCGYVGGQIYCYGGDVGLPIGIDQDIYSLNVSAYSWQNSAIMEDGWYKIVPAVPFQTEKRIIPTSVVLSNGKQFMIQGGQSSNFSQFENHAIIYDTSSNSWLKGSSFTDNGLVKQIYYSSVVNLPNDSVGFYGGSNPVSSSLEHQFGFSRFTKLSTGSGIWSAFSPQSSTLANFFPFRQTATINPNTGKVYYLGGSYYIKGLWEPREIPFSWAAVFDTNSGTWSNETLKGSIPTSRMYHTASLLPNSQDIILYGGSESVEKASLSICYTLNLETNIWTKQNNVKVPEHLKGPRSAHSGADGELTSSVITIDVSNVSDIFYTTSFVSNTTDDSSIPNSNDSNSNDYNSKESDGLSKEAIGGIVAGSIVVGLGIIFFYLRRQKKAKQKEMHEIMDVDWDKIEEHYKETATGKSGSPHFTDTTEITENTSGRYYSPNLVEENNDSSYPKNKSPDIVVNTVKPSVNQIKDYETVKPDMI
ncbi:hypothetical protein EDC94DRAFT_687354 [Helicostylum pulchrum]|nr:hypothetical protein EDC94DRAFT_687354 [Helicostylum pulchrum]